MSFNTNSNVLRWGSSPLWGLLHKINSLIVKDDRCQCRNSLILHAWPKKENLHQTKPASLWVWYLTVSLFNCNQTIWKDIPKCVYPEYCVRRARGMLVSPLWRRVAKRRRRVKLGFCASLLATLLGAGNLKELKATDVNAAIHYIDRGRKACTKRNWPVHDTWPCVYFAIQLSENMSGSAAESPLWRRVATRFGQFLSDNKGAGRGTDFRVFNTPPVGLFFQSWQVDWNERWHDICDEHFAQVCYQKLQHWLSQIVIILSLKCAWILILRPRLGS